MKISSIWRYPVKSMGGEQIRSVQVSERGLEGDRAFALFDPATRKVGTAKSTRRFASLLQCKAETLSPGIARITLPDATVLQTDQPDAEEVLAHYFGAGIQLISGADGAVLMDFPAGTLGGKYIDLTEAPVASAAPPGTLFDLAPLFLVTTSTLRALAAAYPEGDFALERFRPNVVLDTGDAPAFIENTWVGQTIPLGGEVEVQVALPCPRCVMTTLPRPGLPLDPGILKTIARLNSLDLGDYGTLPCLGVYAAVTKSGRLTA